MKLQMQSKWPKSLRTIFVISIRPTRKKICQSRLGILARYVKSWTGINGKLLNLHDLKLCKKITETCVMRRGQIGCFESHKRIWKWCVDSNTSMVLIFEDDVTIYPSDKNIAIVRNALKKLGTMTWDILLLGRNYQKRHNKETIQRGLVRTGEFWGLFAYILTLQGAKKLMGFENVLTIHRACDVVVSNHATAGDLDVFALNPCLCS